MKITRAPVYHLFHRCRLEDPLQALFHGDVQPNGVEILPRVAPPLRATVYDLSNPTYCFRALTISEPGLAFNNPEVLQKSV